MLVFHKTIEILEALPVPEGLEIFIEIPDSLSIEQDKKRTQSQQMTGILFALEDAIVNA